MSFWSGLLSAIPVVGAGVCLRPADATYWPLLWSWMQDNPTANLDDDSPQTETAFLATMQARIASGERIEGIEIDGMPVGVLGHVQVTPRLVMLHGLCISPDAQRQGIGLAAILDLLARLKAKGVEKVTATYYATNAPIRALLQKVGFRDEGFLVDHVTQEGHPVSVYCVSCFLKG